MKVLVVGGAGYIGSHMVKMLHNAGHTTVTVDNLSSGYRDAVLYGDFINADIESRPFLDHLFSKYSFDGVMNFASYIQVGESINKPIMYYENNVSNTLTLLSAMMDADIKSFIFSSTAAIFGEPKYIPVDETHPHKPINPYGQSKLMVEQMLPDLEHAYGLNSICLRYFNAAGADPEGELGERHTPETHLIPLILQAASGRRDNISIFGTDYDTPDGTCIRDYIHVQDLCSAHLLAMESLVNGGSSQVYNIGNGQGYSNRNVVETVKTVTGKKINILEMPRRDGDSARLVADSKRLQADLGWKPKYPDLDTIILHAWNWEQKHNLNLIK